MTTNSKVVMTDPARELAELCDAIRNADSHQTSGEQHLAAKFGVELWSLPFYEIVFTILKRIDLVSVLVSELDLDTDYRGEVIGHLNEIGYAFSAHGIRGTWHNHGAPYLSVANVQVLKAISGQVRQRVSYRKLDNAEIAEIDADVEQLIEWLTDHQLSEQDFIRQALIEGLQALRFRLQRLNWLGWGYTLESLKDVISAYMMLERGSAGANVNPDAEAVLKKTATVIQNLYAKVKSGKDVVETGNWLLGAYGAASLFYQSAPVVKGLLG